VQGVYQGKLRPVNGRGILNTPPAGRRMARWPGALRPVFFFFITLGLEMSDTKVYEP